MPVNAIDGANWYVALTGGPSFGPFDSKEQAHAFVDRRYPGEAAEVRPLISPDTPPSTARVEPLRGSRASG
jgi:hypothetical protein